MPLTQIPYPQPVSTHSLLSFLHLPTHIKNHNRQHPFLGNLTPSMATSPYRAYVPNLSLTYSPAPALFYCVHFLSDETTPLVTFVALVLIQ